MRMIAAALLTVALAAFAFGQEITGSIQGTVKDPNGASVPNATVTATSEQRTFNTQTDAEGAYTFEQLPPGRYKITATASGFGTVTRSDVPVELGRRLQVNIDLSVAGTAENVNVTSDNQPIVDVTSSKTATNITQQQIQELPKTLNFTSVLEVAPGTRAESRTNGFQVDGASGSENVFIVDGVEVTNVVGGGLGSKDSSTSKNIPVDFVKEVQVKSAGYEAEYGGATGGVINVVTRGGTNEFHGEARMEIETSKLRGSDNPQLLLNPTDPTNKTSRLLYNRFGKDSRLLQAPVLSLGGPIVKNKLWFFSSYAPQFFTGHRNFDLIEDPNITHAKGGTSTVPLDTRDVRYEEQDQFAMTRLDFSPTSKLTVNGSFIYSPVKTKGPSDTRGLAFLNRETAAVSEFNFADANGAPRFDSLGGYTPANQLSLAATYTATSNLVLSFRFGRNYLNDKAGSYGIGSNEPLTIISVACANSQLRNGKTCPTGTGSTGFPTGLTSNSLTNFDITKRLNYYADATYVKRIFGQQHIFKGGYQRNNLSNDVDFRFAGGRVQLAYGRARTLADGTQMRGDYGYYVIDDFARIGNVSSNNQAVFFQDSYQIHPRVTLNVGIRTEKEFLPAFPLVASFHPSLTDSQLQGASTKPIDFGWGDKLAPRIGGAWDVFGNGKLKISGSYSVFYDIMKYTLARGSFGGEKFLRSYYTLDTPDYLSINLNNRPGTKISGPSDLRFPSNLAGADSGIDPSIKPYREHEYTGMAEYSFNRNLVLSARLTRKTLDRAIEDIGAVAANGDEIFTIGNPGEGLTANSALPIPKPVRRYTGLEIRLDKRFSSNGYLNLSYVRSSLYGNYSGLASSDELALGTGRNDPNVSRYYDYPFITYDSFGKVTNGPLATDRPNTFKAFGGYNFNYRALGTRWTTQIGGSQYIYQGIPLTTEIAATIGSGTGVNVFPNGRGDLGRTNVYTQTDLVVNHFVGLTERTRLKFSVNVINLFNERNELDRFRVLTGVNQTINYGSNDSTYLNSNGDFMQRIADQKLFTDPRYNQTNVWQDPIRVRFGFGIEF
jgi:hypothetical protein